MSVRLPLTGSSQYLHGGFDTMPNFSGISLQADLEQLDIQPAAPSSTSSHKHSVSGHWGGVPEVVLAKVGALLGPVSLSSGRLTCREWRVGLSLGVRRLRPRLPKPRRQDQGATWQATIGQLPHIFPLCTEIDFRQCQLKPSVVPLLAGPLARITKFTLRLECVVSKHKKKQIIKFEALMGSLRSLGASQTVEVEFHVTDRPYWWNNNLRDADVLRIASCTPPNVAFTTFNLAEHITHNISAKGMHGIAALGSIRELVMVTASCWGADETFRRTAELTQLTRLVFGTGLPVSNAGLLAGLTPLSKLRSLQLFEFDCITHQGIDGLSRLNMPCLQELSLVSFEHLTDRSLESLSRMTGLQRLDLKACFQITPEGLPHLNKLPLLSFVDLNACFSLTDGAVDALVKAHPRPLLVCTRQGGTISQQALVGV